MTGNEDYVPEVTTVEYGRVFAEMIRWYHGETHESFMRMPWVTFLMYLSKRNCTIAEMERQHERDRIRAGQKRR